MSLNRSVAIAVDAIERAEAGMSFTSDMNLYQCQRAYIERLCGLLMKYGQPAHEVESAVREASRKQNLMVKFHYDHARMIMSFTKGAQTEHSMENHETAPDTGKLSDIKRVHSGVLNGDIPVQKGFNELSVIDTRKPKFSNWMTLLAFSLATICVGGFGFGARAQDLPILFGLGGLLGLLNLVQYRRYTPLHNVFAGILLAFLSVAFSIVGGNFFCFSSLAQSSIAMLLPGFHILSGVMEMFSGKRWLGCERIVTAIFSCIVIAFGLNIGTGIGQLLDPHAKLSATCTASGSLVIAHVENLWLANITKLPFVAGFALCLLVITQAKWRYMPATFFIAVSGWLVNYTSSVYLPTNMPAAAFLGTLTVGLFSNIFQLVFGGDAVGYALAGLYIQVPSNLALGASIVTNLKLEATRYRLNVVNVVADAFGARVREENVFLPSSIVTNSAIIDSASLMIQLAMSMAFALKLSAFIVFGTHDLLIACGIVERPRSRDDTF